MPDVLPFPLPSGIDYGSSINAAVVARIAAGKTVLGVTTVEDYETQADDEVRAFPSAKLPAVEVWTVAGDGSHWIAACTYEFVYDVHCRVIDMDKRPKTARQNVATISGQIRSTFSAAYYQGGTQLLSSLNVPTWIEGFDIGEIEQGEDNPRYQWAESTFTVRVVHEVPASAM